MSFIQRLVAVNGTPCSLQIGTFAYFRSDVLQFYWCDPEPKGPERIDIPSPGQEWRYYYEPAFSLVSNAEASIDQVARDPAQVSVEVHPEMQEPLSSGRWIEAHELARQLGEEFKKQGFQPDGLRVKAGDSWQQPLKSVRREHRRAD